MAGTRWVGGIGDSDRCSVAAQWLRREERLAERTEQPACALAVALLNIYGSTFTGDELIEGVRA